jgi:hypothetical protein
MNLSVRAKSFDPSASLRASPLRIQEPADYKGLNLLKPYIYNISFNFNTSTIPTI